MKWKVGNCTIAALRLQNIMAVVVSSAFRKSLIYGIVLLWGPCFWQSLIQGQKILSSLDQGSWGLSKPQFCSGCASVCKQLTPQVPRMWFVEAETPPIPNPEITKPNRVYTISSTSSRHKSGTQQNLFRKTRSDELFHFGWIFSGWIFLLWDLQGPKRWVCHSPGLF